MRSPSMQGIDPLIKRREKKRQKLVSKYHFIKKFPQKFDPNKGAALLLEARPNALNFARDSIMKHYT